jgi:hypothetical protein
MCKEVERELKSSGSPNELRDEIEPGLRSDEQCEASVEDQARDEIERPSLRLDDRDSLHTIQMVRFFLQFSLSYLKLVERHQTCTGNLNGFGSHPAISLSISPMIYICNHR